MSRARLSVPLWLGSLLALGVLAGCTGREAPAEAPRTVLVAQAGMGDGAGLSLTAYAGEVRAREEAPLAFRVGGKVVRRLVDAGDRVRAGDVLAELDPGDLQLQAEALQAQAAAAEAQLARARADHARIAALAKDQLVSASQLDQATAALRAAEGQARAANAQRAVARNQAAYSQLRAPRDGVVATRQVEVGQVVAAGQPAFTLAAEGSREVAFALPESGIRAFAVGQPVVVEPWSAKGTRLAGRIREIAPSADPQARTFAARATLDGEAARAVDLGQSVRVYIPDARQATGLRVPNGAIVDDGKGGKAVWVVDLKTGIARRRPVQAGAWAEGGVAVARGLRRGEWVVVAGGHLLHDGQVVRPVDRANRPVAAR